MISEEKIRLVFGLLRTSREEAYEAAKAEMQAKQTLKDREWSILVSNPCPIDGRNAEQREAQLAMLVAGERDAYLIMKDRNARAGMNLELAEDRVQCLQIMVELMKIKEA
jgi:hypothetical protein